VSLATLAAMSDAMSVSMSLMVEHVALFVTNIILFVMIIFVMENGFGLGFGGPGIFYDGFETSWIKKSMTKF